MSEKLKPCPACGGEVEQMKRFVNCPRDECNIIGPNNDPDGHKWNAMVAGCAKAPAGMSDAELIARAIRAHALLVSGAGHEAMMNDVDAELARREKERQT